MEIPTESPRVTFTSLKKGLIKINNSENVYYYINKGENYIMHLTESDTLLYLLCSFRGLRACDMKIIKCIQNNKNDSTSLDHTFSYQYENYNAVHYTSFKYREKCDLYKEEFVFVPNKPMEKLFEEIEFD